MATEITYHLKLAYYSMAIATRFLGMLHIGIHLVLKCCDCIPSTLIVCQDLARREDGMSSAVPMATGSVLWTRTVIAGFL